MGMLQVDILGTSFSIKSDEDSEYLARLLKYYRNLTDSLEKKGGFKNPTQIAVMAGLMLCDQVYSDKKKRVEIQEAVENNALDSRIDEITERLISKIDSVL